LCDKINILADIYFSEFYTDIHKRRNIEDSLGNGIFNSNGEYGRRHAPPYSFIVQLLIEKNQNKLKLYPIHSDNLATFWQT